jgi:hypothetical protein
MAIPGRDGIAGTVTGDITMSKWRYSRAYRVGWQVREVIASRGLFDKPAAPAA